MEIYCNNYIDFVRHKNLINKSKLINVINNNLDLGYYSINEKFKFSNSNNIYDINNIYKQLLHVQIHNSYKLIYDNNINDSFFNTFNSLTSSSVFNKKSNIYLSDSNFLNFKKKQYINYYTLFDYQNNNETNFLLKQEHKNNLMLDNYKKLHKTNIINLLNKETINFIECINSKLPKEWCIKIFKIEQIN